MERGLNDYQMRAQLTAKPADDAARWMVDNAEPDVLEKAIRISYAASGLASEAGELNNKWKKVIRDKRGALDAQTREALVSELGDVLWYIADMASQLGVRLADVAQRNTRKLADRQDRGVIGGSGDQR